MIADAYAAAQQIFSQPFRRVFLKVIGLTLLLLSLFWAGVEKLIITYIHAPWPWLATTVHLLTGIGLVVGIVFLVAPVSFVVAGFFFDELANHVELDLSGAEGRGRPMSVGPAIWIGIKFGLVSLLVNFFALTLLFVPGVNLVAFFGANAYLLGRGFFELAALRYRQINDVRALRRQNSIHIFLAGTLPAALALVPIANLLTPLFATALLVRIAQPIVRRQLSQPV